MNLGLKNEAVAVTGCLLHIKHQAAGVLLMQATLPEASARAQAISPTNTHTGPLLTEASR